MPFFKPRKEEASAWDLKIQSSKREGYRAASFGRTLKDKYTGWFHDDFKHGKGTQSYEKGLVYDGDWVEGKRHGYGSLSRFCPKTGIFIRLFTGYWENNLPSGQGLHNYPGGELYRGEFHNGKRHGLGTMYYNDGSIYVGMWKDDLKNGIGRYVDSKTGCWYEGRFAKGTKCGLGRYFHKTQGLMQEGVWYMDQPQVTVLCKKSGVPDEDITDKPEFDMPSLTILKEHQRVFIEEATEMLDLCNKF